MSVEIAPAKVNLFLHITGRTDGETSYHLLESLFVFTKGGDSLTFSDGQQGQNTITFSLDGPFAVALTALGGGGDDNLIVRAGRALQQVNQASVNPLPLKPVHIHLEKNLPVAAGIGGGSADAAAALRGLNKFWDLSLSDSQLYQIALNLGADVPACLKSTAQWVTGVGDQLVPCSPDFGDKGKGEPLSILLVNPGVTTLTPQIFADYKQQGCDFDLPIADKELILNDFQVLKSQTGNSLHPIAAAHQREIDAVLSQLNSLSGCQMARMSGSGATCFALFADQASAVKASKAIKATNPDWWVMADQMA